MSQSKSVELLDPLLTCGAHKNQPRSTLIRVITSIVLVAPLHCLVACLSLRLLKVLKVFLNAYCTTLNLLSFWRQIFNFYAIMQHHLLNCIILTMQFFLNAKKYHVTTQMKLWNHKLFICHKMIL